MKAPNATDKIVGGSFLSFRVSSPGMVSGPANGCSESSVARGVLLDLLFFPLLPLPDLCQTAMVFTKWLMLCYGVSLPVFLLLCACPFNPAQIDSVHVPHPAGLYLSFLWLEMKYPIPVPKDQLVAWAWAVRIKVTVYFTLDWHCMLVCIYVVLVAWKTYDRKVGSLKTSWNFSSLY